jgi:anti-anti-sigma factor
MSASPSPGFSRADLHVHTTWSDGTSTPEDVLNWYALHAGVRVFAITDHDTLDGARAARDHARAHPELFGHLELIVGEEVTSKDGHVLGLFLSEWVPPGMSAADTVKAIHSQGGVAIAAHPYTSLMRWNGLVGVGDLILEVPFDAIETRNSNFTEVLSNRKAARVARGMAQVGCSDGHFLEAIGLCYTDFPGATGDELRAAISARSTVAGGRCYGIPTLLRYVLTRLRTGGSILPQRNAITHHDAETRFDLMVHSDSGLDGAILTPVGRLDVESFRGVKETIQLLIQARVGVVIDLSQVELLDSAGITSLVAGLKGARAQGVGFCLASPSAAAQRALVASRLGAVFPMEKDVKKAREKVAAIAPMGPSRGAEEHK